MWPKRDEAGRELPFKPTHKSAREWLNKYAFGPDTKVTLTGRVNEDALPRKGKNLRTVIDSIKDGMTATEINEIDSKIRGWSGRKDEALLYALCAMYCELPK